VGYFTGNAVCVRTVWTRQTASPPVRNCKPIGVSPETRCECHRHCRSFHWKRGVGARSLVSSETRCEYQQRIHVFHRKLGVGASHTLMSFTGNTVWMLETLYFIGNVVW